MISDQKKLMKVTQISMNRFHHFHLARQLEKRDLLNSIWTGYPHFKLKDELGIPKKKIKTFPWVQTPYLMLRRLSLPNKIDKSILWLSTQAIDYYVAAHIKQPTVLVALSSLGLHAGIKTKKTGGYYVCDRGSTHIRFQERILTEEYKRHGFKFEGIDSNIIKKEEKEYETADKITVPSEFVKRSFIELGVPADKLIKIPYGARLDRFKKTADPDANTFRVLWVGGVSIRKGFMDLIEAFESLKHPGKELLIIGEVMPEIKSLLRSFNLEKVTFKGMVNNAELPAIYSSSHVLVLPSIEEGLAMVQGEALACGCPVIATTNTGSEDLFTNGVEGFIVPINSPRLIGEHLQQLADDKNLREQMSEAAIKKVSSIGGWDRYGENFEKLVKSLLV